MKRHFPLSKREQRVSEQKVESSTQRLKHLQGQTTKDKETRKQTKHQGDSEKMKKSDFTREKEQENLTGRSYS